MAHYRTPSSDASPSRPLGLGLDAGGSGTRWALADDQGQILAAGQVAGLSALLLDSPDGRQQLGRQLVSLAAQVQAAHPLYEAAHVQIWAGFTGLGEAPPIAASLTQLLCQSLRVQPAQIRLCSDVMLAFDCLVQRGQGHLLYAGTGSIAVHVDAAGRAHRAGGRGYLLDDAGSGYWMAREALRMIWRAEDAQPGAWPSSVLAQRVFAQIGGSDWTLTRDFLYRGSRGSVGLLALAVAEAARAGDAQALALLQRAGEELALVVQCLLQRVGPLPVVLAGRIFELHPLIESTLRQCLPTGLDVSHPTALLAQIAACRAAQHVQG